MKKRITFTFEPNGPIREMISREVSRRGKTVYGQKTIFFEDCIASSVGSKYPELLARHRILREEAQL